MLQTDKGLPRYRDLEESDVFILLGSEDLVPALERKHDGWVRAEARRDGFLIRRYRPRVEGLFARIERWTRLQDGMIHWRSFGSDNVLTIFGDSAESRISDPERPGHVFEWLISASYDGRGNAIRYRYAAEDLTDVDEGRRGPPATATSSGSSSAIAGRCTLATRLAIPTGCSRPCSTKATRGIARRSAAGRPR